MSFRNLSLIIAFALVAGAGCKKKASATANPAAHVQGTPHTDEVEAAWRNTGLTPEGFSPIQPAPSGAAYCEHGTVSGVDTVVCEYATDEAMAQGIVQVKDGWARVEAHTGVILKVRHTTMAAVDRERREPSGKTINQMAKVFLKL